ncbi:MAG: hypothetical protein ACOWWO_16995 [Peptococcaceae bacterium]
MFTKRLMGKLRIQKENLFIVRNVLVIIAICSLLFLSMSFFNPCCFIHPGDCHTTTSTYDQAPY